MGRTFKFINLSVFIKNFKKFYIKQFYIKHKSTKV